MQEIELKITEGKSKSKTNHLDIVPNSVVRIFVNKDYTYGYFIPETKVFDLLDKEDREQYFTKDTFFITKEQANHLIAQGMTPYQKHFIK